MDDLNSEKIRFYNQHKEIIHPLIKAHENTKPLWRRLFWTTGRDSKEYKSGCYDIFKMNFPETFHSLKK